MGLKINAGEIFTEDRILKNSILYINDGLIESVGDFLFYNDYDAIDFKDYKVIPGLIDMHIHGYAGRDTMDGDYEGLNEISKHMASNGVTSFLPTTVTSDFEKLKLALKNIGQATTKGTDGARILGAYVEGPYITEKHRGAHPKQFIREINIEEIEELIEVSGGNIRVMTIAPEKKGAFQAIDFLRKKGVKVSIGHTDATFEIAKEAVDSGADIAVHVFNGMRGIHHREPGTVGEILTDERAYAELIADGIHVHPQIIKLITKCKGKDKICLISDCIRAGGLEDGEYLLGELKVKVVNSICRIKNGSLAGSTLKLANAVKNMIEFAGIEPLDAVHMGSLIPARVLGLDDRLGSIKKGKIADITVLDSSWNVVMTIINGRICYADSRILDIK